VLLNKKNLVCKFASTYCCEQALSNMKINKPMLRTRVTDGHLGAVMRVAILS